MRRLRFRAGFSLPELLASLMMMAFVVVGSATLLNVGSRQQRTLRIYSQVQTDLRMGIRRASRTLRHASAVLNPSAAANFPVKTSGASQVIVRVPEPTGVSPSSVEVRFYVSGGVLYAQRSDTAGAGVALESSVQSVAFKYYRTASGTRTAVDANPSQATEIQITVTALSGAINSKLSNLVALRNVLIKL